MQSIKCIEKGVHISHNLLFRFLVKKNIKISTLPKKLNGKRNRYEMFFKGKTSKKCHKESYREIFEKYYTHRMNESIDCRFFIAQNK